MHALNKTEVELKSNTNWIFKRNKKHLKDLFDGRKPKFSIKSCLLVTLSNPLKLCELHHHSRIKKGKGETREKFFNTIVHLEHLW